MTLSVKHVWQVYIGLTFTLSAIPFIGTIAHYLQQACFTILITPIAWLVWITALWLLQVGVADKLLWRYFRGTRMHGSSLLSPFKVTVEIPTVTCNSTKKVHNTIRHLLIYREPWELLCYIACWSHCGENILYTNKYHNHSC